MVVIWCVDGDTSLIIQSELSVTTRCFSLKKPTRRLNSSDFATPEKFQSSSYTTSRVSICTPLYSIISDTRVLTLCATLLRSPKSGFIVGAKYEEAGIIKAGAMMINAVSNSAVPHLSIIAGSSYGAGNYAMVGRAYDPRFLFSWPQSRCSVMGADALAGVMDLVARDAAQRSGKKINVSL